MININTMNKLEAIGIGPDIDKLENYIALINFSDMLGNSITDWKRRGELIDILKELKPNTDILKFDFDLQSEEIDEYDKLFKEHGKFTGKIVNKIDKESFNELIDTINNNGGTSDIYAFALPDGIDIRIIYRKGLYYSAYTYKNGTKGKDITEHIRPLIPHNLQEISQNELLELHSRITIKSTDGLNISDNNKLAFIVEFLVNECCYENIDKFEVITYKALTNDLSIDLGDLWEEHELLNDTELNVTRNALIRNITEDDFLDAIEHIEKYFRELNDDNYRYSDIFFTLNSKEKSNIIILNLKGTKSKVYKTVMRDVKWITDIHYIKPLLIVDNTITEELGIIKDIELNSLKEFNILKVGVGKNIYFYIDYMNNKIICDENGTDLLNEL